MAPQEKVCLKGNAVIQNVSGLLHFKKEVIAGMDEGSRWPFEVLDHDVCCHLPTSPLPPPHPQQLRLDYGLKMFFLGRNLEENNNTNTPEEYNWNTDASADNKGFCHTFSCNSSKSLECSDLLKLAHIRR